MQGKGGGDSKPAANLRMLLVIALIAGTFVLLVPTVVLCTFVVVANSALKKISLDTRDYLDYNNPPVSSALAALGGRDKAPARLCLYLRIPAFMAVHKFTAARVLLELESDPEYRAPGRNYLLTLLSEDIDPTVRRRAFEAIYADSLIPEAGTRATTSALVRALIADKDPEVRQLAARSLRGPFPGEEEIIAALCRALADDTVPIVRQAAAETLREWWSVDKKPTQALCVALASDPGDEVRVMAAISLEAMTRNRHLVVDAKVIECLAAGARDASLRVRRATVSVLFALLAGEKLSGMGVTETKQVMAVLRAIAGDVNENAELRHDVKERVETYLSVGNVPEG